MTLTSITSSLPTIQKALQIARGGATIVVATAATSLATTTTAAGGGTHDYDLDDHDDTLFLLESTRGGGGGGGGGISVDHDESSSFLTPKARAILCMAIAMSFHYLGYSFARPSTIAIFTSSKTGYTSPAAFPLAMAFVSPMSIALLIGYTRLLDRHGPRGALTLTTLGCAGILLTTATLIFMLQNSTRTLFSIPLIKYISGPLFVFRESYVQLITSQYWSFMSSILTPEQSARWFAPISGLTSITSALAGLNVSFVVGKLGLAGAIYGTGIMMILSLWATSKSYAIAEQYGFNPTDESSNSSTSSTSNNTRKSKHHDTTSSSSSSSSHNQVGLFEKASSLFRRVPTLWALFIEVLSSQGLATLLNVCFVNKLSVAIPNDTDRAGWMGKFFALINIITMCLQFGVLPSLMQILEPRILWRILPMIVLTFSTIQSTHVTPSLYIVSATLLVMKTLEYSARRLLDEMVYVPLDFESRYVGKEVVGVLAYRLGKSIMSLSLSGLTAVFGNFGLQELSMLSTAASCLWLGTAWNLSHLIPTRKEATELYSQKHNHNNNNNNKTDQKKKKKNNNKSSSRTSLNKNNNKTNDNKQKRK